MTIEPRRCDHCGSEIPAATSGPFCCTGCEAVYGLLRTEGLTRYYALADGQLAPVASAAGTRSYAWLEPMLATAEAAPGPLCALELDVQGIHCAACVWLLNEVFSREPGGASITVNPALGKVALRWNRGTFELRRYLERIERFGYLFGPSRKSAGGRTSDLAIRLGVCAAITVNVMLFSFSFYAGLAPSEGELFGLFTGLTVALSSLAFLIGGWPFFRAAWQGVRTRVLHLDLPIAIGLLLAFSTSLVQVRSGRGDLAYFDTLNTFVTLMLLGRWLQQRVIEKNRRFLLDDDGAEGLVVRRLVGSRLEWARAPQVRAGDRLVLAPGDLCPVDAQLCAPQARFSTDWITGEPEPRELQQGARIPAGSFQQGRAAVQVVAASDFSESPLVRLLAQVRSETRAPSRFWSVLARGWVVGVLAISTLGFALWSGHGTDRAIEVAVALLVVTCPCAIGIAVPLAYELAQSKLRRRGLFVKSPDLLDRLTRVRRIVFDKTGTLTLGRLELVDRGALERVPDEALDAALDLSSRSNHPVSRCLHAELARTRARFTEEAEVVEHPGLGVELSRGGHRYRLGRPSWALASPDGGDLTVLSRDGERLVTLETREAARPDAGAELEALAREGCELWLLSGDAPERVREVATALGFSPDRVLGGLTPEQKAAQVSALDRDDTLYLGDGVNDSFAFARSFCAGTPAIDRPVMPARSDFFLLGEGIAPLREALHVAQRLRAVVLRNLFIALTYNAVAIATCLLGAMSPLRAAVAMPLSSLSILLLTAHAFAEPRWRARALASGLQEAAA